MTTGFGAGNVVAVDIVITLTMMETRSTRILVGNTFQEAVVLVALFLSCF
jgi:hypothetical protein